MSSWDGIQVETPHGTGPFKARKIVTRDGIRYVVGTVSISTVILALVWIALPAAVATAP